MSYQPKTGQPCGCRRGVERDNCPRCEGTGQEVDFPKIRATLLVCGTRRVVQRGPRDYRVICATCDGDGTIRHETRESASSACVRDSGRKCSICGAS